MFKTSGLNHITIFVKDLQESLRFYTEILRMDVVHLGEGYAYLESGQTWFCISQQASEQTLISSHGVNHIALTIDEDQFDNAVEHLRRNHVPIVREPVLRGVGKAVNFLDPDGLQWEFHASNLQERMTVIQEMEKNRLG